MSKDFSTCTMGVGCNEAGTCFAVAQGKPEMCAATSRQSALRDEFGSKLMQEVNAGSINLAEAAAAALGACAAIVAVIQNPADRRKTAEALIADFPARCEHRHAEIMRRLRN